MSAEALVALVYKAVLRRPVDPGGLATYTRAFDEGRDAAWLLETLMDSDEYHSLTSVPAVTGPSFPLDFAPPMSVETTCDPALLQALWDHVSATWSNLGSTEPYWSVLTEERFRMKTLDPVQRAAFHETGEGEVHRLNAWARRNAVTLPTSGVCAEFGCGVGRVTRALARQFRRVVAFDVSPLHLREAKLQMQADGIDNVDFVCIRTLADLQALAGVDFFYSVIVLQHNPPPIIADILQRALAGVRPGGSAFFQVPTYALDYSFSAQAYRATMDKAGDMEMHVLPQPVVLDIAQRAGLRVVEVQPDWCVGQPDRWISSTFLLSKPTVP
jgi:2-polyprenyl-3-methyl-5-hydroxy-6-metoxy-1,4-benzoquinol methylase